MNIKIRIRIHETNPERSLFATASVHQSFLSIFQFIARILLIMLRSIRRNTLYAAKESTAIMCVIILYIRISHV